MDTGAGPTRFKSTRCDRQRRTYACYDQIWTSPDLHVAAAHVMRRTQITGDGSDHDPTLIDLNL